MLHLRPILFAILMLLTLLPLSACEETRVVQHPPLSFAQYLPIHMNVAEIEIIERYKPPHELPYVEHLIPYSPTEAVEIWAKQRLRAVGIRGKLEIIITDGPVTVHNLPHEQHWSSLFTGLPDKRYDAKVRVEMRIYMPGRAVSKANVEASAKRSIVVNDSATPLQRSAAHRRMINDLMTILNAQLEVNMFKYMAEHISFSHNP